MPVTATDAAARWASGMANARSKIQAGIEAVTAPPGQAAARQKGAYVQGVTANQDKWAARVSAVTTQAWQDASINKGLDRIASGATQAQPKVESFMTQLLPFIAAQRQQLPPRGTPDQNINRMVAWARAMMTFQKR